jgi:hypothetical protein
MKLLNLLCFPFYRWENEGTKKVKCREISREFSPEQNDADLESISQTVQKLLHFQILPFRNSRWRPEAKMMEFFNALTASVEVSTNFPSGER